MKLTFIALAGIMATAAPVFAEDGQKTKYYIKQVDAEAGQFQTLKDFTFYINGKEAKYKNDSYETPKLFMEKDEVNNFYKKAN